jgi:protein-L-isoaspartate(D-aspartate) O-methyltransferase
VNSPAEARRRYAEELRFTANIRSRAVVEAFAAVPRERFVGPGPWRVKSPMDLAEYWTTDDADPAHVYHDVLIALDEARGLNNGQPSLWAYLFDRLGIGAGAEVLHLGCGTGYYTAIAAELAGPAGRIAAVEIDAVLAQRAHAALAPWPRVKVRCGDGAAISLAPADAIFVSAGATHPLPAWLDALKPDGRLLLPLTTSRDGPGAMLLVTRRAAGGLAARFLCQVGFVDFAGAREPEVSRALAAALRRDRGAGLRSLRRDPHAEEDSCWLHGTDWCLSRRAADADVSERAAARPATR